MSTHPVQIFFKPYPTLFKIILIPSQSSTFQMLAAAIAENNFSLYKQLSPQTRTGWNGRKAENFKINTEQKVDLPEFVRIFWKLTDKIKGDANAQSRKRQVRECDVHRNA
jgi:hypothetical protein